MNRDAEKQLVTWKNSKRRKPLILEGARQVGKTWLVKKFANDYYENMVYINFEEQKQLRNLFEQDFDVARILSALLAVSHQRCTPGKTLIFLDEIQEAHEGLTALKYFYENMPEQHIIVAGSLLGLELHRHTSFPVGKVQTMRLYPMSFGEYLQAMGENELLNILKRHEWDTVRMLSTKYSDLLRQYFYVGGMPEVVLAFSESHDWIEVREIQKEILSNYSHDFSKHAPSDIAPRIRQLWESVPAQLSKENRKFVYGLVREGARAREYELALQWLYDCGLIYQVHNVTAPRVPLKSYEMNEAFKLFVLDVGLLGAMTDLDSSTIVHGNSIFTEFKGALTEQFVLQQLILTTQPYYWAKSNSRQEIDFLIQKDGKVFPIEVKAEQNLRAKSLRLFMEEGHADKAIRMSIADFKAEEHIVNLPLYAVSEYDFMV